MAKKSLKNKKIQGFPEERFSVAQKEQKGNLKRRNILPDSVRYQFLLFRKATQKYFKDVGNDLLNKAEQFKTAAAAIPEKFRQKFNQTFDQTKIFFQNLINKEATLFKNTNTPFTFKPFHAIQGALVFAAILFFGVAIQTIIYPPPKLKLANLIKPQSIIVKQTEAVVAGQTASVKWTTIIKKSDITNQKYLLQLPKTAKNIKIKTISKQEAQAIASAEIPNAQTAITAEDRKVLAYQSTPWLAALSEPTVLFNKLSLFTKYLFADLEQSATDLAQTVAEQINPPSPEASPGEAEIQNTTVVDLSAEAPTVAEVGATSEVPQIETPAVTETPPVGVSPEVTQTPAEEMKDKDDKKEEKQETKQETKEEKKQEKENRGTSEVPQTETPAAEVGVSPALTQTETPAAVETPQSDYVAVTYETPAPIITEQNTDNGKLVTVSSNNTEAVNCEALKPNIAPPAGGVTEVLQSAGASLLTGFTNIIASITKFFTADLEQAVTDIVDQLTDKQEKKEAKQEEKEIKQENKKEDSTTVQSVELPPVVAEETPAAEELEGPTLQELPALPNDSGDNNVEPVMETPGVNEIPTPGVDATAEAADSAYQACLAAQPQLTNVLAHTNIPEIYKVGQEDKIKIKWTNENGQEMPFTAFDLNNNGKIDYIEWTVPHLSDQIFEIIFISKAWHLDSSQNIIEDIYDTVKAQDGNYATIPVGDYARVTFEKTLDNTKDITIYAKPLQTPGVCSVEVYPVYTDENGVQTQGYKLELVNDGENPDFSNIDHDGKYRALLTNLATPTDVFDLKIARSDLAIDYIVDPTIGDSFSDETKIGAGTTKVAISSGIKLAPCYTPTPSWTQVVVTDHNPAQCATNSTYVRDLSVTANSTTYICKDIYCDDTVCILWPAGAAAPGTVCIATNTSVYPQTDLGYGLLWSKTNIATTKAWANTANSTISIAGGDIGGTHATNKAGNNSVSIGGYKWLERYYTSTNGTAPYYPAMDACKAKGLGWRLPTILELDSIRDSTALSGVYSRLPGMSGDYWSSSESSATFPFYFNFGSGDVSGGLAKSYALTIRCVRGY